MSLAQGPADGIFECWLPFPARQGTSPELECLGPEHSRTISNEGSFLMARMMNMVSSSFMLGHKNHSIRNFVINISCSRFFAKRLITLFDHQCFFGPC